MLIIVTLSSNSFSGFIPPQKCFEALPKLDGHVEDLRWSRLDIPPERLPFVAEDQDARRFQLKQLSPHRPKDKRV